MDDRAVCEQQVGDTAAALGLGLWCEGRSAWRGGNDVGSSYSYVVVKVRLLVPITKVYIFSYNSLLSKRL
jgi:hypothetical protein